MNNKNNSPFPVTLDDATSLRQKLDAGELTAETLVRDYLTRLKEQHGRINAATEIMEEEALAEAKNPRPGPLSGIPISVKETLGMGGKSITAGSIRMPPVPSTQDPEVVRRVREAGAIVIARSNIPEFAMTGETTNLRFGRTNNPMALDRTCGGSSGGEGALVASGSSVLGLGSDILGSLRIPASFCGVVGFKPASDAVDKTGTWPVVDGYADSFLCVGPITRSVRDARLVYDIIANVPTPPAASVAGRRLLLPDNFLMKIKTPVIRTALTRAQKALETAGMVTEKPPFPHVPDLFNRLIQIIVHTFESPMHQNLKTADGEPFQVWAELWRQIIRRPTIDGGLFQMIFTMPIVRPKVAQVEAHIEAFNAARTHYYDLLGKDGVLLLPAMCFMAPKHGRMNLQSIRPGVNPTMTPMTFCNYLNLPAISVPAWSDVDPQTGLVPGIMLACAPGAEGALLDAAAVMEQVLKGG